MKNFRQTVLVLVTLATVIHLCVWITDKVTYKGLQEQKRENSKKEIKTIKRIRMDLEAEQKKEIESYGWTEKEKGLARIPVERASSYYLRSLPHE